MIKFDVFHRQTGAVNFTAEIDCEEGATRSKKLGLAVNWGIKHSANLHYADLSYADLRSADLRSANLHYADLRYANLRYANLSYADLSYADLSYADLSSANLHYTDLSYANLRSANLRYADLSSANLHYTDLRSANLSYAENATIPVTIGQVGKGIRTGYSVIYEGKVMVKLGCFWGTEKEAVAAVEEKYGASSGYLMMVKAACKIAKERGILNPTKEKIDKSV